MNGLAVDISTGHHSGHLATGCQIHHFHRTRRLHARDLEQLHQTWNGPSREDVDLTAYKEECAVLRKNIEKLGNVNLEALQEEGEQEERHTLLAAQEHDLKEATKRLEEVVHKIDSLSTRQRAA